MDSTRDSWTFVKWVIRSTPLRHKQLYLTVQFDLIGKRTSDGTLLESTEDITAYLLNGAGVALVPFYAFGAPKNSTWYRLSVGTVKDDSVSEVLNDLRRALEELN